MSYLKKFLFIIPLFILSFSKIDLLGWNSTLVDFLCHFNCTPNKLIKNVALSLKHKLTPYLLSQMYLLLQLDYEY